MSLILAGVGAGVSLLASIYGKSREARERRRLNRFIDQQSADLSDWFRKESGTQVLDTAEGQSLYQGLRRTMRDSINRVDNRLVRGGGTAESRVASQQAMGETLAGATRQMAGIGTQRRNQLMNVYQTRKDRLNAMRMGSMQGQADAWSTFANNAASSLGDWLAVGNESGDRGWAGLFSRENNR